MISGFESKDRVATSVIKSAIFSWFTRVGWPKTNETSQPALWASQTETKRQGNRLTATSEVISPDGQPFALDRSAVRITVLGTKHAVDILGCSAG